MNEMGVAMKKLGLLNQPISNVIAGMGHGDALVIADAGLPIPASTPRIDLAVRAGLPAFLDVLSAVLDELKVEEAIAASELRSKSPEMFVRLQATLGSIPLREVAHETFKAETAWAKAVVRTGEFTPYANVILVAGVVF
jgi:D-ribose pyranase